MLKHLLIFFEARVNASVAPTFPTPIIPTVFLLKIKTFLFLGNYIFLGIKKGKA
jgi:hypothetical protein